LLRGGDVVINIEVDLRVSLPKVREGTRVGQKRLGIG